MSFFGLATGGDVSRAEEKLRNSIREAREISDVVKGQVDLIVKHAIDSSMVEMQMFEGVEPGLTCFDSPNPAGFEHLRPLARCFPPDKIPAAAQATREVVVPKGACIRAPESNHPEGMQCLMSADDSLLPVLQALRPRNEGLCTDFLQALGTGGSPMETCGSVPPPYADQGAFRRCCAGMAHTFTPYTPP
jgi:hypothetical protein